MYGLCTRTCLQKYMLAWIPLLHIHMQTHPQVTGRRLKQSNGKPVYKCWFPGEDAQQEEDAAVKRFLIVVKPREDGDLQVSKPDSAEMAPALEKEATTLVLRSLEFEGTTNAKQN